MARDPKVHDLITRPLPDEMGSKRSPIEIIHGAACEVCGQHGTKDAWTLDKIALKLRAALNPNQVGYLTREAFSEMVKLIRSTGREV